MDRRRIHLSLPGELLLYPESSRSYDESPGPGAAIRTHSGWTVLGSSFKVYGHCHFTNVTRKEEVLDLFIHPPERATGRSSILMGVHGNALDSGLRNQSSQFPRDGKLLYTRGLNECVCPPQGRTSSSTRNFPGTLRAEPKSSFSPLISNRAPGRLRSLRKRRIRQPLPR